MDLTDLGRQTTTYSKAQKAVLAGELRSGNRDVARYVNRGICYEAVAYVLYLEGMGISTAELISITGKNWISKFKFSAKWDGHSDIPVGEAVGFYSVIEDSYFHAGLSIGGTSIRAINGQKLGASWLVAVDLRAVLTVRNPDGTFNYEGNKIKVSISNL